MLYSNSKQTNQECGYGVQVGGRERTWKTPLGGRCSEAWEVLPLGWVGGTWLFALLLWFTPYIHAISKFKRTRYWASPVAQR